MKLDKTFNIAISSITLYNILTWQEYTSTRAWQNCYTIFLTQIILWTVFRYTSPYVILEKNSTCAWNIHIFIYTCLSIYFSNQVLKCWEHVLLSVKQSLQAPDIHPMAQHWSNIYLSDVRRWMTVGPPSATLAQHLSNIGVIVSCLLGCNVTMF